MTVAEMIAKRTVALRTILHESGQAIRYKGGTPADDLSGLEDAILSIPSGGGALPVLTNPAEVGHVVAGKEYIDASGTKKTGTLVVCDSIEEVEHFGVAGTGVYLDLESTADGSGMTMTLPEPNLLAENIKNGVSIFGVLGSAKTLRVETGTITPAEDVIDITIPAPFDGYCALVLTASDSGALEAHGANSTYGVRVIRTMDDGIGAIGMINRYNGSTYSASTIVPQKDDNGNIYITNSAGRYFRAGIVYNYYVYYWEDDV